MELRPYQEEARQLLRASFSSGNRRMICCMPTGSGKTPVQASICQDVYTKGGVPMILANRTELVEQAKNKLNQFGLFPSMITAGKKVKVGSSYIASVQTLRRRELPEISILLVDEAHLKDFNPILDHYAEIDTPIIGFTATPVSTKKNDLSKYYQDLINPIGVPELIDLGNLMPAVFYGAKEDLSDLQVDGTGDFSDKSQFNHFNKSKLYMGVVENYIRFAHGTKALVFNVNVEHSLRMTEEFQRAGISSAHLDGTATPAERKRILHMFEIGVIQVLNSVAILTTGFDSPSIETIIINRSTRSLALYLQMLGRGSRPYPGKAHFNVIDMGSNCFRLGFYDDIRVWDLQPKTRKSDVVEVAPMKECKNCSSLIYAVCMKCKHCGYEYPVEKKELLESEFTLIEKPKQVPEHLRGRSWGSMNVRELIQVQEELGYKVGWIVNQLKLREDKAYLLKEYAEIKGHKPGWVWMQLKEFKRRAA